MSEKLDALLSQPLAKIPDNGFSNRVMAEMELRQLRRDRLKMEISAGFVVLAVLVLPFTEIGKAVAASASTTVGMTLAGLALGSVLTVFVLRTR